MRRVENAGREVLAVGLRRGLLGVDGPAQDDAKAEAGGRQSGAEAGEEEE